MKHPSGERNRQDGVSGTTFQTTTRVKSSNTRRVRGQRYYLRAAVSEACVQREGSACKASVTVRSGSAGLPFGQQPL
ncbi:MAG: hypothetical protein LBK25_08550 [Treponema sp.]|nr:hypothetical protein [Treponema sp.]